MCATIIAVLSYAFQLAGATLLLLWSIGKCDKKIKQMCIAEHGGGLIGTEDERGTHITIDCKSLQRNAKTVYLNIAAFVDIISGYTLAILARPVDCSPLCMLAMVIAGTTGILLLNVGIVVLIAKIKYGKDVEICDMQNSSGLLSNEVIFISENNQSAEDK